MTVETIRETFICAVFVWMAVRFICHWHPTRPYSWREVWWGEALAVATLFVAWRWWL